MKILQGKYKQKMLNIHIPMYDIINIDEKKRTIR